MNSSYLHHQFKTWLCCLAVISMMVLLLAAHCAHAATQSRLVVGKDKRIWGNIEEMPVADALRKISEKLPLQVIGVPPEEQIELRLRNATLEEVLRKMMKGYNYVLVKPRVSGAAQLTILGKADGSQKPDRTRTVEEPVSDAPRTGPGESPEYTGQVPGGEGGANLPEPEPPVPVPGPPPTEPGPGHDQVSEPAQERAEYSPNVESHSVAPSGGPAAEPTPGQDQPSGPIPSGQQESGQEKESPLPPDQEQKSNSSPMRLSPFGTLQKNMLESYLAYRSWVDEKHSNPSQSTEPAIPEQ